MPHNDERAPQALGDAVRRLRLGKCLTQQELANRLAVPQSRVSNIESARRRLGVLEALELCHAMDCTLDDLITEYLKEMNAA
ncbi:MAG: helix-turn-helix transcriptional regulator [Propionibacteriaceae bacterium]|nr:helix-turn-helix transcriptional regulator [Propionibacteriaceae bacterium]